MVSFLEIRIAKKKYLSIIVDHSSRLQSFIRVSLVSIASIGRYRIMKPNANASETLSLSLSLLYIDVAISFSFRTSSSFVSLLEHHPPSLPHGATSLIESTAPRWRFARRGSWRTSACSSANSTGSFLSSISQRRSVRMVLGHWARGSRSPLFSSSSRDRQRYREFVSLRRRGSSVCGRSRRVTGPSGFDLFLFSLERTHLRPGTTAIPTESVTRDMRPVDDSICCEEIEREFLRSFSG